MIIKQQHRDISLDTFSQYMKVRYISVRFVTRNTGVGLWLHKKSAHEGVTYKCRTCDAQFTHKRNLSTHVKSQHQGVKFPCGLCDYQATEKNSLSKHNKTVHHTDQMTKINCDFCDYQTVNKAYLSRHRKCLHSEDAEMSKCNVCPFKTVYGKSILAKHMKIHMK